MEEKYEVAENIRTAGLWNESDCRRLCELAGLEDEWEAADGDEFEIDKQDALNILKESWHIQQASSGKAAKIVYGGKYSE